jgi:SAM-dependent methyltransferase
MEGISISLFKLEALIRDHRIHDELKITDLRYLVKRFMFTSISSLVPIIGRAEKVLDVGCGSAPYRSLFSNVSCYIGIDLNPQKRPNIVASAELLPIRSRSFNVVISTQVLMYLNEPLNFLKEASRVLDQGGFLLISAHGIWYERHAPGFKDLWRWTLDGLFLLLQKASFEIVAYDSMNPYTSILQLLLLYIPWKPFAIILNTLGLVFEKLFGNKGPRIHLNHVILAQRTGEMK